MTIPILLQRLKRLDIVVELSGARLRLSGPTSALTTELHAELRARRDEIVSFLTASAPAAGAVDRLVPVQSKGTRSPFFCVPGHNGDVFCYRPLAEALGGGQPLIAFQPPGVDGKEAPLDSVESLGAVMVESLRAMQPDGPYHLGGYCTGGVVAFETAQQLVRAGEEVASLVLFGTPSIGGYQLSHRLKATPIRAVGKALRMVRGDKPAGERAPAPEMREEDRERVEQATLAAVRSYKPSVYPGRIVLFIPSRDRAALYAERYMDWQTLATGGLTVHPGSEGTIHSRMLRSPAVESLAPILLAELTR